MHATHHPPNQPDRGGFDEPTAGTTLRSAADYLTRHGWIQHGYFNAWDTPTPAACSLGALSIVSYGYPNPEPFDDTHTSDDQLDAWHRFCTAEYALCSFLGLDTISGTDRPEGVHDWNDNPDRSADEVIATLRAAATHHDHRYGHILPSTGVAS